LHENLELATKIETEGLQAQELHKLSPWHLDRHMRISAGDTIAADCGLPSST